MIPPVSPTPIRPSDTQLMDNAKTLEAAFLAQMLGFAGLGETSAEFGGGVGEQQFASLLRDEQARLIVDRGGIGLAESIFEALKKREA